MKIGKYHHKTLRLGIGISVTRYFGSNHWAVYFIVYGRGVVISWGIQ